jgi:hypothetical protein
LTHESSCELCQAEGAKLYDDALCWVRPCNSCKPDLVVVFKQHTSEISQREREYLVGVATIVANREFGMSQWEFDFTMRKTPQHFHLHCREGDR